jgi:branched-chain amino acid transport system substrate-binding protein
VLYECVSGCSPFRRESEAETLWAHMQAQYAPLPGLEPVLARGFARDPEDRYATCRELIEAAAGSHVPSRLLRHRVAILAAGLLVLAASAAAAVLVARDGSDPGPLGSGVAAIGADGGRGTFTGLDAAPGSIAFGAGAVWMLLEPGIVARIDPATGQVRKTYKSAGQPSDLAAGAGAVWVGNAGDTVPYTTTSVSRIDPRSGRITHTATLPDPSGNGQSPPSEGRPLIAVGAGGVWAASPNDAVTRLDPRTGRRVATLDVGFSLRALAAGAEGVWFLTYADYRGVRRIDPETKRVGETIKVGSEFLSAIAVGAGSVWAMSPQDGQLWRIVPGAHPPLTRTIDVGTGASLVTFADGAVWTGNFITGVISRVDPLTNRVTARVRVGAPQALAAGAGSAWVSVAADASDGVLPASICAEVESGGRPPDVLVASDVPLRDRRPDGFAAAVDAIRGVLRARDFRAGRYTIGYRSCDSSPGPSGFREQRRCAANANAYARAERLVAVIGPYDSFCAQPQVPIANRAPGGPLAMISPSASRPGLTRGGSLVPPDANFRGEPDVYYPSGQRNFFRVTPRDDQVGAALAVLAEELGLRDVYVVHDPDQFAVFSWTGPFRRAAARLGIEIAGVRAYDPEDKRHGALARAVARSGADGVFLAGLVHEGGDRVLRALRARLGPRVAIMSQEGFVDVKYALEQAGRAARGLYVATAQVSPDTLKLTAAQERLLRALGTAGHAEYALHLIQATEVVLDAIARSDGTRASVLRELRKTRVDDGVLGSFGFDRYGDITPATVGIYRITGRTPIDARVPRALEGAVADRVVRVPARLSGQP